MFYTHVRLISFLCFLWIFLGATVGWTKCKCEEDEAQFQKSVKELEEVYKTASDFRANFWQEAATTGSIGTVGRRFSGTVMFKKTWDDTVGL